MAQPGIGTPARVPVNSLVNEDALPEWLRNAANSGALPPLMSQGGAVPSASSRGGGGREPAPAPPAPRPPVPSSPMGPGGLGANHLFDESALPEWLRSGTLGQSQDLPTGSFQGPYGPSSSTGPYIPPGREDPRASAASAFPSIERAGSFQISASPESGVSAPSLIDSNALPQWLSGNPETPAQSMYGRDTSRGIPANSLVDENSLPPWLRSEHPAPQPGPNASSMWNGQQAGNQPLPAWLSQGYAEAQSSAMEPSMEQFSAWNNQTKNGAVGQTSLPSTGHLPGSLAAGEFIDESVLPEWLRSQGGMMGTSGIPAVPGMANPMAGAPPAGQLGSGRLGPSSAGNLAPNLQEASLLADGSAAATFSASELIDPSALPEWVRDTGSGPAASFSSTSGWTTRQPVPPAPGATSAGVPNWPDGSQVNSNGSFGAINAESSYASPIPSSELPPWLSNNPPPPAGRVNPPAPQRSTASGWPGGTGGLNSANDRDTHNRGRNASPYNAYEAYPAEAYPAYENAGDFNSYGSFDQYDQYDQYAGYDAAYEPEQESSPPERRGWRRFFGRK